MKIFLVFLALISLSVCQTQSVEFRTYFNGGLPFCTQCGTPGQYACSPDTNGTPLGQWNNGEIRFSDPIPAGNFATSLRITISGAWSCNPDTTTNAMFAVSMNNIALGVRESTKGVNKCKCDTCDQPETFTFTFRNSLPGYIYRGQNVLKLVMYTNSICVNNVLVQMDYKPVTSTPPSPLPQTFVNVNIPTGSDAAGCNVCNNNRLQWCSKPSNSTGIISFNDPVPSNVVIVGVEMYISYNFMERSYNGYLTQLIASLENVEIGNTKLSDSSFRNKCGCYGDLIFNSPFYQRGWPGYNYKGRNNVKFTAVKYSESYGNLCVGRVGLNLLYYSYNSTSDLYELEKIPASVELF